MKNLSDFVRSNILRLSPYSTARDEAGGAEGIHIWLDANESPFCAHGVNRYPDPMQKALKEKIAHITAAPVEEIFIGNGSDEAIDLMYRIFCTPGRDNAVAIAPTYGMYKVCADINDIEYRPVALNDDFSLPVENLLAACDSNTRLIWICSPNNPTANSFPPAQLEQIASGFNGILVIDGAYADFSADKDAINAIRRRNNNIVWLRTLSKAFGMAALRVGIAIADPFVISLMNRVKYPYNVNQLSQAMALEILEFDEAEANVAMIKSERASLADALASIPAIEFVYPSDSNFLLVKVAGGRADELYNHLRAHHIMVRNRSKVSGCEGSLRITVGTPEENSAVVSAIKNF
jgi:histidinol-phosphate aminotransferase